MPESSSSEVASPNAQSGFKSPLGPAKEARPFGAIVARDLSDRIDAAKWPSYCQRSASTGTTVHLVMPDHDSDNGPDD